MNIAVLWHPGSSAWGGRDSGLGAKARGYDAFWHPDDCWVFGRNAALGAKRLLYSCLAPAKVKGGRMYGASWVIKHA